MNLIINSPLRNVYLVRGLIAPKAINHNELTGHIKSLSKVFIFNITSIDFNFI